MMLLGAIADDFTGASDLANTLAKEGMSTLQFVGVPTSADKVDCEAGVVSLKTRSIPADQAVAQSLAALDWLLGQGCRQILFKYCSTFDSTPRGNIGPVAEALVEALGADVAVVCPAFPATGRRIFMGHLFVGDRLLNESGMEKHPLTPMTDANLRRWLALQTRGEVGLVDLDAVRCGRGAIERALANEVQAGRRLVVVDATADEDLRTIGEAIAGHRLVTGGSGIALGLPENFRRAGLLRGAPAPLPSVEGPAVVLSGSCSVMSRRQVAGYLEDHPGLAIDPADLMSGAMTVDRAADWYQENSAAVPIFYSTADPAAVAGAQSTFGAAEIAERIEQFFGGLAARLADAGVRRIVVGGGETSGAVVAALGVRDMAIGREIDPGVPILISQRNGPLGLALKSGNFGTVDFFAKAIRAIEAS